MPATATATHSLCRLVTSPDDGHGHVGLAPGKLHVERPFTCVRKGCPC